MPMLACSLRRILGSSTVLQNSAIRLALVWCTLDIASRFVLTTTFVTSLTCIFDDKRLVRIVHKIQTEQLHK